MKIERAAFLLAVVCASAAAQDGRRNFVGPLAVAECRLPDGSPAECQAFAESFPAADYGLAGDGSDDQQILDGATSTGVKGVIFYVGSSPANVPVKTEYATGGTAAQVSFQYGDSNWLALVQPGSGCWAASATASHWYYSCSQISDPAEIFVDSASTPYTLYATGTCGSLTAGQECFGDDDSLGFSAQYIHSAADPDTAGIQVIASYMAWAPTETVTIANTGTTQASLPCRETTCDHGEAVEVSPKGHSWMRVKVVAASSGAMSMWAGRKAQTVR